MESLNKQQLILLALLVSFVTSVATGIITVSLMDQAPQSVTQTINRVVEKTIERVVTEPQVQAAAVAAKETVVVEADDLVTKAIEKNARSVVRIREVKSEGRVNFAGLGLVVSESGLLAADISLAYRKSDSLGNAIAESYQAVFSDGRIFPLNIVYSDQSAGLIFFQVMLQDKEKGVYRFTLPEFSRDELRLGQSVIALSNDGTSSVSTGIISSLVPGAGVRAESSTTTPGGGKEIISIKTDISSTDLVPGSILLNLKGEVIGQSAGSLSSNRNVFLPIGRVLETMLKVPVLPN